MWVMEERYGKYGGMEELENGRTCNGKVNFLAVGLGSLNHILSDITMGV